MDTLTSKDSPSHPVACACGRLQGSLQRPSWLVRARCYCQSCQDYAEQLGAANSILDEQGGTEVLITEPRFMEFSQGEDQLACLRISSRGPLRWYAKCCNTPIGATMASPQKAFVSIVHSCLGGRVQLEQSFGPPEAIVHTDTAKGEPKPRKLVPAALKLKLVFRILTARLSGSWRTTPFFDDGFQPIATAERPAPTPPDSPS